MTLYEASAYFLIYSLLGWCVEVVYSVTKTGVVVNRGYLNGPVCPIYGCGMLAVLEVLLPVADHKAILLLGGMLFSTIIELIGGWILYRFFHQRWWDYTNEPFNLGGYICLRFSIIWGIGVVLVMDIVHPPVSFLVKGMPHVIGIVLMLIFLVVFVVDGIVTTRTVMKMKKHLERLEYIAASMREVSDIMTDRIGNQTLAVEQRFEEGRVQAALGRAELEDRIVDVEDRLHKARLNITDRKNEVYLNIAEYKNEVHLTIDECKNEAYMNLVDRMKSMEQKRDAIYRELQKNKWIGSGRILQAFPHLRRYFHIDDRDHKNCG